MHVENADSQDISDFERACSFKQQYESGLFKSRKEFAQAMGLAQGTITKLLTAAEIMSHEWLSSLFPNKVDITLRRAYKLAAHLKNPLSVKALKSKAKELTNQRIKGRNLSANIIFNEFEKLFLNQDDEQVLAFIEEANKINGLRVKVDSEKNLSLKISHKAEKAKVQKAVAEVLKGHLD